MKPEPLDRRSITLARLFARLDYTITFRRSGWWECLLARGAERWPGCGLTRRQALDDAASKALPSHAARSLLAHALEAARTERATQRPDAASIPMESPAPEAARVSPAEAHSVPPGAPTLPARDLVVPAAPPRRTTVSVPEVEFRAAPRPNARRIAPAEAQALYAQLEEDIESALEEAGLLEPERQRLLLLSWIARARSIENQAASSEAIERTRAIARRLGRLAKIWWPGSVRALGIDTLPADCAGEIPGGTTLELASWSDVATAAEGVLEACEDRQDLGIDAHGWADGAALEPAHPRPDTELAEVVAQIERVTCPICLPSGAEEAVPAFAPSVEPGSVDVAAMATAARKLRWLRGATAELELWGAAVGRLRWIASVLRARGEPIARVLDRLYVPKGSWAQELRYDPDKKRRQKARKALISAAGAPKPASSAAELRDWLQRAMELGDMLPNERIARVLEEQAVVEQVLALDAPTFSEKRNQRTRLETIQQMLRREPATAPSGPARPDADEDSVDATPTYLDRMLDPLLLRTRGKRVLFVSNRNDPEIDERLREMFAFEEVDHCEVKSSNVTAKAKSVEQGGYDMVLAATGFLSHSTEGVFRDAARRAQIPHVRVNRGRPLSVALALAREFGVRVPIGTPR